MESEKIRRYVILFYLRWFFEKSSLGVPRFPYSAWLVRAEISGFLVHIFSRYRAK